ncbi:MAG: isocitrate lyase/PEP mutase family protein [Actinomycetota bacterium]|nr:isocitrate lyase/PEP mutase family protein [Actinomycetota bacterium]
MPQSIPPALGGGASGADRRSTLRELLVRPGPLLLPGVFDAMTGVLAERAGFPVCYLTGAGLANTQMAVPDVGLLSFDTVLTQAFRITSATSIPLVVDIDTGFGGPTSVMHVVRALESVGVAGVQLEDQQMPKRCGHFERKQVVPTAEMQAKVDAATAARSDDNMVIIARTDAVAVEGLDAALQRAKAYLKAGADVLFVEAPASMDAITRIPEELGEVPLVMNVVQGGKTPELPASELHAMGYKIILHANLVMRAMASAGSEALAALQRTGATPTSGLPFLSWQDRQAIVRLPEFDAIEDELALRWGMDTAAPASGSASA